MLKKQSLKIARPLVLVAFVIVLVVVACSPKSQPTPTMDITSEPTITLAPPKTETPKTEAPVPEPATPEAVTTVVPSEDGTILYDFESGAQGWMPRGEASISVADDVAHSGSRSLLVTNRTAGWHGATMDVLELLESGNTYEISAYVRLAKGAPASRVIISMQRTPTGGDTVYEWIAPSAEGGVTDSEWVHLQGRYSYSGEAKELLLYLESPDAELVSFYIDDITIGGQLQPLPQTDIPSVYETLAPYFPVGAAFSPSQLDSDPHTELMTRHFNSLTPENTMKPGPIQPSEGNFAWANADRLVEFAQAHNMAVHGHTLVWHQQAAEWMFKDAAGNKMTATPENKELLLQRLETHIREVVGRYKGAVNVWDVVNEVIDANRPDCMRRSTWYEITGMDYIVTAFRVAREVDPDATLILNDYNTYAAKKRECIYTVVHDLQAQGAPIDGIGMQMHVNIQIPSDAAIEAAIERFAELGEVHITELDMSLYTNDTTSYAKISEELLLQQGYRYRDIFEVLKRHTDSIGSVTFWGLADDNTWLKTFPTTRLNLPLLFDEQLQAKYAYWGVVDPSQLPGETQQPVDAELEAPRTTTAKRGTPVIDAVEDAVWANAEEVTTGVWVVGKSGSTARVKMLWDDTHLYVYAVVSDSLLSKAAADAWEQDSFEVFVDQNNAKTTSYEPDDGQYRVNYENAQSFGGDASADKITSATKIIPGGYIVELAIRLDAITPQEGMLMGVDFQVNNDENGNGIRDSVVTWNDPTPQSYQNTSRLGILQFTSY